MNKLKDINHIRFYKDKMVIVFNNNVTGIINIINKDFKKAFNFEVKALIADLKKIER
jgi:hypothetical protein